MSLWKHQVQKCFPSLSPPPRLCFLKGKNLCEIMAAYFFRCIAQMKITPYEKRHSTEAPWRSPQSLPAARTSPAVQKEPPTHANSRVCFRASVPAHTATSLRDTAAALPGAPAPPPRALQHCQSRASPTPGGEAHCSRSSSSPVAAEFPPLPQPRQGLSPPGPAPQWVPGAQPARPGPTHRSPERSSASAAASAGPPARPVPSRSAPLRAPPALTRPAPPAPHLPANRAARPGRGCAVQSAGETPEPEGAAGSKGLSCLESTQAGNIVTHALGNKCKIQIKLQ